jgi:hypothetical protein
MQLDFIDIDTGSQQLRVVPCTEGRSILESRDLAAELAADNDSVRRPQHSPDVTVLNWRTWPEGLWGQKSQDGDRFPDPRLLFEEAHDA